MRKLLTILLVAVLGALAAGACASYWDSQGQAAQDRARAARDRAQAEQEAAQAAIIAAQGSLALDQAQAGAIEQLAGANGELLDEALTLARRSPDSGLMAAVLALAALFVVAAMAVAVAALRRPAPAPAAPSWPGAPVVDVAPGPVPGRMRIETPEGVIELLQDPGETRYTFLLRARATAELLGGGRLLGPGPGS